MNKRFEEYQVDGDQYGGVKLVSELTEEEAKSELCDLMDLIVELCDLMDLIAKVQSYTHAIEFEIDEAGY